MSLLEVRDLHVAYGELEVVRGVSFSVEPGEIVTILGPNGCGKSTLLAILGLLDSPSNGSYVLNGRPVDGLKTSERARIRNRQALSTNPREKMRPVTRMWDAENPGG